jgi:hypothetical protein
VLRSPLCSTRGKATDKGRQVVLAPTHTYGAADTADCLTHVPVDSLVVGLLACRSAIRQVPLAVRRAACGSAADVSPDGMAVRGEWALSDSFSFSRYQVNAGNFLCSSTCSQIAKEMNLRSVAGKGLQLGILQRAVAAVCSTFRFAWQGRATSATNPRFRPQEAFLKLDATPSTPFKCPWISRLSSLSARAHSRAETPAGPGRRETGNCCQAA